MVFGDSFRPRHLMRAYRFHKCSIELDLTLNLTDPLSLVDGNTVTIDFDYAARRTNGTSRTIFVDSVDSNGNFVNRFILGERSSLGVGAENSRQRPGFSVLDDVGNSINMVFGTPPGAFWWGSDATPDEFDALRDAHMSLTIGASTFDFSTTSQDEMVDFRDITPFIALLSNLEFQAEADINEDGSVDFRDIVPFIGVLSGGGA